MSDNTSRSNINSNQKDKIKDESFNLKDNETSLIYNKQFDNSLKYSKEEIICSLRKTSSPKNSNSLYSSEYYAYYLNSIRFIDDYDYMNYNSIVHNKGKSFHDLDYKQKTSLPKDIRLSDSENMKDKQKEVQLNDSFSTSYSGYTVNSRNLNEFNRYKYKSIVENYLDSKYYDIYNIYKKYSLPYIPIEVKKNSIYFIIKSFNIENIHKAIKYGVWSTTYSGNILFDKAFNSVNNKNGGVYLFFSTNSTFAFQGIARLKSNFQQKSYNFWKGSDKYRSFNGSFNIEWIIIKDIPNSSLDKILINNIPFSKLRNGVEIAEQDALLAISIYEKFYYCSSFVLSDFIRLDMDEKYNVGQQINSITGIRDDNTIL